MGVDWVVELDKLVVHDALVKDQIVLFCWLLLVIFVCVLCTTTINVQVYFHVYVDVVNFGVAFILWTAEFFVFFCFFV